MRNFKHVGRVIAGLLVFFSAHADDGLHLDWRDLSVPPGVDFYAYANGSWQKQNPIPDQYASWGSFLILQKKVEKRVHQLLIHAAEDKTAKSGSLEQKVGDFYFSGMDLKRIEAAGVQPLQAEFERIAAMKDKKELQALMTHLQAIGVDPGFNFVSMQDFKNSEVMIGAAVQAGLGLPDRDYYLKTDAKFKEIRTAYVKHITNILSLLGDTPAEAAEHATRIMSIETRLAQASMSQSEQRDPDAIYHMMGRSQLQALTPNFSWPQYFAALGKNDMKQINVAMPKFFRCLNQLMQDLPLSDWQIYLRWHLIDAFAPYVSTAYVEENFQMTRTLSGAKKLLPRWERVVATENEALGFAIGKLYVEKYFSPETKQAVLQILNNIRRTLREDLAHLTWMTPKTRQAAIKKLDAIEERVGYPSRWWDYSSLTVDRGPFVVNVMRANEFLRQRDLNKIAKPVDRSEWAMTPQTVNAYYDPSMNNINLPAGILQSPFFDPSAPAAVNYGAIGFVIGHEITHGFDDQGARFDAQGNLKNWWTKDDLKKFQAATRCIMNQYNQYKVEGNFPVQGPLVMGEATADLGGLLLAYHAFRSSEAYKKAQSIDGVSPDQQFFLGMAHVWAMNMRPEQIRHQVTVDPHPPVIYRVNGTVANMPVFQKAFGLPEGASIMNKTPCVIW
jgi:putative endopeptidase